MKYSIVIIFSFLTLSLYGQKKGNGNIITKTFELNDIEIINLSLYAKTKISLGPESKFNISIDENLIDLVEMSQEGNKLTFEQKEWIQPTKDVEIQIFAPHFNKLIQSTHDETEIINFSGNNLTIDANTGKIKINGEVKKLSISVGVAEVNAENLFAVEGDFFFESWGRIRANVSDKLNANATKKGSLELLNKPSLVSGNMDVLYSNEPKKSVDNTNIKFIKFTLRNNSKNRHNFYVEGPKKDGSNFSYGFPMMPYQKRNKDWTNGTKVYKVSHLGVRKLVKTIRLDDEGKVVDIFENKRE